VRIRPLLSTAVLLCIVLSACRRVPPPELSTDPESLLTQVRRAQANVQRLRGSARVHVSSPSLSGTVDQYVAVEKPDRVRIETFDFFGNVAALLVADGEHFGFYDARARVFYRGAPTPENISRLLPIVMPAEELVTILCGSAPILPGQPVTVTPGNGQLLLTLAKGDVGQRLAIGERAAVEQSRIREMTPGQDGAAVEMAPAYDLDFSGFAKLNGIRFPSKLELAAPAARVEIVLSWRSDLELNESIDTRLFETAPPKGARVVELGEGAVPRER
jgi:outer membrane lipoprotein-sorting protein